MAIEITDAKISFVSLVNRAANKKRFLIMKQEELKMNYNNNSEIILSKNEFKGIVEEIVNTVISNIDTDELVQKTLDDLLGGDRVEKSSTHYLAGIL